jgi:hypothetical protein
MTDERAVEPAFTPVLTCRECWQERTGLTVARWVNYQPPWPACATHAIAHTVRPYQGLDLHGRSAKNRTSQQRFPEPNHVDWLTKLAQPRVGLPLSQQLTRFKGGDQ